MFLYVVCVVICVSWLSGYELKLFFMWFNVLISVVLLNVKLMCMFVSECVFDVVCMMSRFGW